MGCVKAHQWEAKGIKRNHVGNLITAIDLGRGARQGDPIASLLFVLCIEMLLITIRTNPNIESYKFFKGLEGEDISSEAEAFADDVTLTLPYQESSLREAVATFNRFSEISGLTLNQGKTQVMIIGKQWNEGVRHPKFVPQQATAGSRGSGGRLNLFYSAVEVVAVQALRAAQATQLKATLSNQFTK